MSTNNKPIYSCPYKRACDQLGFVGIYNLDTHIGDCHLTTSGIILCPANDCMDSFTTARDVLFHLSRTHPDLFTVPKSPVPQRSMMTCTQCGRKDIKGERHLQTHQAIAHLSVTSKYCSHPDCKYSLVPLGQPPARFQHVWEEHAFLCGHGECAMEMFECEEDLALHTRRLHGQAMSQRGVEQPYQGKGKARA